MFNETNPELNGEAQFFNKISKQIQLIFDVGCRTDTEFLNFNGEVHYFDPVKNFIDTLSKQKNSNSLSVFNDCGLGDVKTESYYYPKYQSFYDRTKSCGVSDENNKIFLKIIRGDEYVKDKGINHIDFLKIDTEGYEFKVLKGFGEFLKSVGIIQFEYGGTYIDTNVKLVDVINYLKSFGFEDFSYLSPQGPKLITDFSDHYNYCNIVCVNNNVSKFF